MDRGFYSIQIEEILGYFNRNQMLIIRNQSLRENLNGTLKQVSSFLSISEFGHINHKEVHSRTYKTKLKNRENKFLYGLYKKEIQKLENILQWDLTSWKM